jgi:hypothetical protein
VSLLQPGLVKIFGHDDFTMPCSCVFSVNHELILHNSFRLTRMWKAMLECHHKQFITVTLAYHVKSSTSVQQGEHHRQAAMHLFNEMNCFSSSFKTWITAHKSPEVCPATTSGPTQTEAQSLLPSPPGRLPSNIHPLQRLACNDGVTPY